MASIPLHDDASRLFQGILRCEIRLYNALNDELRERHGIVASQFEFLRFVRDRPGSRVADIAASVAIGIGATSKGIDRLEAQGWLRRVPNPADRRSSILEVTDVGTKLVTEAEVTSVELMNGIMAAELTPGQLSAAADALSILRTALERDRIGIPVG